MIDRLLALRFWPDLVVLFTFFYAGHLLGGLLYHRFIQDWWVGIFGEWFG